MRHLIKLFSVGFELTTACPCRCDTCGSDAGARRKDELDEAEWLELVRDVAGLGAKRLCLLGGEPFLHPGWYAITRLATDLGLDVDLISCGLRVSDAGVEAAKASGLSWITISIDGTEVAHDRLRRVAGGYRESLDAIRRFDTAGMKVGVTTQVNRCTLATLEDLASELEAAGAIGWQLQLTIPSGRAQLYPELLLSARDMPEVFTVIRKLVRRNGLRPYMTDNLGYMTADEPLLRTPPMCADRCWCGCFAGLRALGVTSHGEVKGCLSLPDAMSEGNVRRESIQRIWGDPERFAYNRAYQPSSLGTECRNCGYSAVCRGGCTSASVTTTGKPNSGPFCARLQGVT
ncbi:MAG TPA: radical SAM protein [Polyangiaceae bacterium]